MENLRLFREKKRRRGGTEGQFGMSWTSAAAKRNGLSGCAEGKASPQIRWALAQLYRTPCDFPASG
jgi:hypothetical protein